MEKQTISNNWFTRAGIIFLIVFVGAALYASAFAQAVDDYVKTDQDFKKDLITYNPETGFLTYLGLSSFDMTSFIEEGYFFEEFYVQWGLGPLSSDFEIRVPTLWKKRISTGSFVGEYYVKIMGLGFFLDDDHSVTPAQVPIAMNSFTFRE